jgi:hypothetical protein
VAREEKNKFQKKEIMSESQTAENFQKIFDDLKEYYDDKEDNERKNEEI